MCPLFGGSDKQEHSEGDTQPQTSSEIDRLRSLSLDRLAAEIFARGFGPEDSGDRGRTSVLDIAQKMVSGFLRQPQDEVWELEDLVGEGVQLLEHARLVQCNVVGTDRHLQWVPTRRGRSALSDGSIGDILRSLTDGDDAAHGPLPAR